MPRKKRIEVGPEKLEKPKIEKLAEDYVVSAGTLQKKINEIIEKVNGI